MEAFIGWYSGNVYERYIVWARLGGPFVAAYWALILCNVLVPQLLWFKGVRANLLALWLVSIVVNVGMWLERYVIVVTSLSRDYLPSSWFYFRPTFWDWSTYIGTLGLFFTLLFLFIRVLPMISIFEMRTLVPGAELKEELHDAVEGSR
jgi:molybdopterin-containing oxidoreductase family membrane subunit